MKVGLCCGSLALTQSKYSEREKERQTDRQTETERERWREGRGTEQLNRQNETLKDKVFFGCLFVCFYLFLFTISDSFQIILVSLEE